MIREPERGSEGVRLASARKFSLAPEDEDSLYAATLHTMAHIPSQCVLDARRRMSSGRWNFMAAVICVSAKARGEMCKVNIFDS